MYRIELRIAQFSNHPTEKLAKQTDIIKIPSRRSACLSESGPTPVVFGLSELCCDFINDPKRVPWNTVGISQHPLKP